MNMRAIVAGLAVSAALLTAPALAHPVDGAWKEQHNNTPGITTADTTSLPYRHRRKPLYPFEPHATW